MCESEFTEADGEPVLLDVGGTTGAWQGFLGSFRSALE